MRQNTLQLPPPNNHNAVTTTALSLLPLSLQISARSSHNSIKHMRQIDTNVPTVQFRSQESSQTPTSVQSNHICDTCVYFCVCIFMSTIFQTWTVRTFNIVCVY